MTADNCHYEKLDAGWVLGARLCEAWGLPKDAVERIEIEIDAGPVVHVYVTMLSADLAPYLEHYRLVADDPPPVP